MFTSGQIIYTTGGRNARDNPSARVPTLQLDSGAEKDSTRSSQRTERTEDTEKFEPAPQISMDLRDTMLIPTDFVTCVLFVEPFF